MDNTFARQRRDTLSNSTRVWKLLQDYPFLKDRKGIEMREELTRILFKENLIKNMRGAWETAKPNILKGLKKCAATEVHSILALIEDCTVVNEKEMENRCILAALPHVLGEKKSYKQKVGEHLWEIVNEDITDDTMSQKVKACSSAKLMSTGSLEYLDSLTLISEGMVVAKYKTTNILNAVICLIASCYVFNAEYPKGANGHSKNIYLFLEHVLIGNKELRLPMGVENFITYM